MKGNFIICTLHQILFKWSNHSGWHGWACGTCEGEEKCMSQVLMGKCEGNRLLGRPRNGWEGNWTLIGCEGVDHFHLVWGSDNWWLLGIQL